MDLRTITEALQGAGYNVYTGKHMLFRNVHNGSGGSYLTVKKGSRITLLYVMPRGRHSEYGMCTSITAYGVYSWANPANSRRDCLYDRTWHFDLDQEDQLVELVGQFSTKVECMNV